MVRGVGWGPVTAITARTALATEAESRRTMTVVLWPRNSSVECRLSFLFAPGFAITWLKGEPCMG